MSFQHGVHTSTVVYDSNQCGDASPVVISTCFDCCEIAPLCLGNGDWSRKGCTLRHFVWGGSTCSCRIGVPRSLCVHCRSQYPACTLTHTWEVCMITWDMCMGKCNRISIRSSAQLFFTEEGTGSMMQHYAIQLLLGADWESLCCSWVSGILRTVKCGNHGRKRILGPATGLGRKTPISHLSMFVCNLFMSPRATGSFR